MLVDSINNRKALGGTESTVLGPFYAEGSPVLPNGANIALRPGGKPCFLSGRVLTPDGSPIAGARLDVWQSGADGFYNVDTTGLIHNIGGGNGSCSVTTVQDPNSAMTYYSSDGSYLRLTIPHDGSGWTLSQRPNGCAASMIGTWIRSPG